MNLGIIKQLQSALDVQNDFTTKGNNISSIDYCITEDGNEVDLEEPITIEIYTLKAVVGDLIRMSLYEDEHVGNLLNNQVLSITEVKILDNQLKYAICFEGITYYLRSNTFKVVDGKNVKAMCMYVEDKIDE